MSGMMALSLMGLYSFLVEYCILLAPVLII